jgi:ectoine hydroxylase-related dioxygenase (phytanoyl-CoA dioxygenase family)
LPGRAVDHSLDRRQEQTMTNDLAAARTALAEHGWCVVPGALDAVALARANAAVDHAVQQMQRYSVSTHSETLDPNAANVRLYNLPEWDEEFVELLRHPVALDLVEAALGPHAIVSNFTGNIAWPGSGSMNIHADQALAVPAPWNEPWTINIIWCLDGVHDGNGATRYVPGSHHWTGFDDVPDDISDRTIAFEAPAGSLIAMDGRLWHTSGANRSENERRAMLFGYYSRDFVRQQVNWDACLSAATKDRLDPAARALLGMGAAANVRIGGSLTRLRDGAKPVIASREALTGAR